MIFAGAALILLLNFISAIAVNNVVINEIELNPNGTDSGNEWIELYNNEAIPVNLAGWYIINKDGENYTINGTINAESFYVLENMSGLDNTAQNISLFDNHGSLKDNTGILDDTFNSDETWQRIPDGTGSFVFREETKGIPNQPTIIQDKTSSPSCLVHEDIVKLNVSVSGFCIEKIVFSINDNGEWKNFTGINDIGEHYIYNLNTENLSSAGEFDWTVYSKDCFNRTEQDGIEEFYIFPTTELSINPSLPNGLNNWYVSEPEFTLTNSNATKKFYQWDSLTTYNYSAPFDLGDLPNGNKTGGILELNYWSNFSCKVENMQSKILKFDFTKPLIKDLQPENNEIIYNQKPIIYAYLDEVYQSNSGIGNETIRMFIDDNEVNATKTKSGILDYSVEYIPTSNLSFGNHSVKVNVSDNSGRYSQLSWKFEIKNPVSFNISVFSPTEIIYGEKGIVFNISSTNELNLLEYIDYSDSRPGWKKLCVYCSNYNKKKTFAKDGIHNITIKAIDLYKQTKEENILFSIDSKKPKIAKTLPGKNKETNGENFYVKYSEDNLKEIAVYLNSSGNITRINATGCNQSGKNKECYIDLDLSMYNGKNIEYWFVVSDYIREASSKSFRVFVDTTAPVLIVNNPKNNTIYLSDKVKFNLTSSESVTLGYFENSAYRKLCTNCDSYGKSLLKTIKFSEGGHNILIRAEDDAGNKDEETVGFIVE